MNRLMKELHNRGIIGSSWDSDAYPQYEWERVFVTFNENFLVTASFSNVLDPVLIIHDARTFQPLCEQLLNKYDHQQLFNDDIFNPWESAFFCTPQEWDAQFADLEVEA